MALVLVASVGPAGCAAQEPGRAGRAEADPAMHGGSHHGGGENVVLNDAVLRLESDAEAGRLALVLGTFDLPSGGASHSMYFPVEQYVRLPAAGWITGARPILTNAAGDTLPQALLHHVNVITPDRRELFSGIMQRVAAFGDETAPISLPWPLGHPVEQGQRLLLTAMLYNPTAERYEDVTLRIEFSFIAESSFLPRIAVQPFYMDVMPPTEPKSYDLPPGHSEKSWEARPARSGRILGMGGHLHDHAVELRLEDATTGEVLWRTRPIVEGERRVVAMPQETFLLRWGLPGLPVDDDHLYRLVAVYDNPSGDTIPNGAMGAVGGILMPTGDAPWPRLHPTAMLRADLRHTIQHGGPIGRRASGELLPHEPLFPLDLLPAGHDPSPDSAAKSAADQQHRH